MDCKEAGDMTLSRFFRENPRAALGFSGGVDSAYLLYAALTAGAQVKAYYVKSPFQPRFELEDARRLAEELGADWEVLEGDPLADPQVAENPPNRCYFCKRMIFGRIAEAARRDGFSLLLDGTNASDEAGDRPGMQALSELHVISPLRLCGLTKPQIRELSRAVFENPQVFVDRTEDRFRDQLRGMTEQVVASGSHIVLLCGPSSSGKTTTANLLVSDLSALGRRAVRISLDDFYRNRDLMPLWEDGTKNFESIEGLDLDCFSTSVNTLMQDGHAEFPIFDFTEGKRSSVTRPMEYDENTILIFEGIHALQPQLRQGLARSNFGIYIHPNTSYVDQDGRTLLDARDLRLTRRIIRDNLHRGTPPLGTMRMWKDVLRGELLYMKPSSGTADVFVNTSHDYEPFLYGSVITELLKQTQDPGENRETVDRLIESYRHFFPIGTELIPQSSLIQEFIGSK